jgi:hypothetical protein
MKSIRVSLWASFAVGAVLSVLAQVHSVDNSNAIPVAVTRRPSLDIYTILQGNRTGFNTCDVDNATYLVKENQCINDRYLSNGNEKCMYYIDGYEIITLHHRMLFCNNSKWRIQHFTVTPEY